MKTKYFNYYTSIGVGKSFEYQPSGYDYQPIFLDVPYRIVILCYDYTTNMTSISKHDLH